MSATLLERMHIVHSHPSGTIAACEDMFNGNAVGDIINMKGADKAIFFVIMNANAGSGDAVLTVDACDDVTPSNTSAIAFTYRVISSGDTQGTVTNCASTGYNTAAASDTIVAVEVDARDLPAGYPYIRFVATEDDSDAVDGAIFGFLWNRRFQDDTATQLT